MKVTSLPSTTANFPSGFASASAGAFYNHTDAGHAAQPVSAVGGWLHSHPAARLIHRVSVLILVALLTLGMGHTATTAIAKLAYANHMTAKGW